MNESSTLGRHDITSVYPKILHGGIRDMLSLGREHVKGSLHFVSGNLLLHLHENAGKPLTCVGCGDFLSLFDLGQSLSNNPGELGRFRNQTDGSIFDQGTETRMTDLNKKMVQH
jgi:hypothetical protein